MTYENWKVVSDCKVVGTWNLHNAMLGQNLDFFILVSSIAGLVGHPGQVNYAASNSFLDSFAQYRESLGLPVSVIDLGGVEGIGFLSRKPERAQKYSSYGVYMLNEDHYVDSLYLAIKHPLGQMYASEESSSQASSPSWTSANQFVVGLNTSKSLDDPTNRTLFRADLRISLFNNVSIKVSSTNAGDYRNDFHKLLAEVDADPSVLMAPDIALRVAWEIGRALFKFLVLDEADLDVNLTLESIGVDSLAAIEIRNWWRKTLGSDVSVIDIMSSKTIDGLGKLALRCLKKKHGIKEDGAKGEEEEAGKESGEK